MKKRYIWVILFLMVVLGILTFFRNTPEQKTDPAETKEQADEDTVVLRIFDKNVTNEAFDDDVAKRIMKETGVRIEIEDATDDSIDKTKAMLRDKSYPDIVVLEQGELVNQYIESEVLIPLDDLVESYGPDIKEMYGEILDKSRYTDGKLYWFANWYGKDTDASAGVLMRKDFLEDLVGWERANSNEPFTLSEYTALLRMFKEKYPTMNGQESIALELDYDTRRYETTLEGMFGLKTYDIDEEGNLHYLPNTEQYKEAILYLNQLYREELLDKEWVINKTKRWQEKLEGGYVFSTWASYFDTDNINVALKRNCGNTAGFYCYKVVADNLTEKQTTYNGRNSLGWDVIGITDKCKNPEVAMKVLNFLASEEGQYLMLWGNEGRAWRMEDGKHVPIDRFLYEWSCASFAAEQRTGIRRWTWMIKNGNGSDGTPYDLTTKYATSEETKFANANFQDSDYWDTADFIGLEPSVSASLGFQWQNIQDIYEQNFPRVICAPTEEYASIFYDKMIDDMILADLEACEAYITEKYYERQSE